MADLADGTNWSKVYDQKLIPMAQFVTSADAIVPTAPASSTTTTGK
ncbi:hypothetical protein [Companilactobacillus paralimentarius]